MQRLGAEMGSFALNAQAETAGLRVFGRHVFDIAALSRASPRRYNLRVWVVGLVWTKLPTPHPVVEPVSDIESGTEIFDAETGGRNGLIRGKYASRDCGYQRFWRTCL
jgi:hypothetical protein